MSSPITVFVAKQIITMNRSNPLGTHVAVRDGRVLGVGTLDLFHDEDVDYATRLREAGVACDLVEVDGAFHGFDGLAPRAPVVTAFRRSWLDALGGALNS